MRIAFLTFIVSIFFVVACNDNHRVSIKEDAVYQDSKESLEDIEKKSPQKFISIVGDSRKNLIGRTVVSGTVTNNAKVVNYKDIEFKILFYSQTGALLEEDVETMYKDIAPGNFKKFKTKFFAPKAADSVAFKVLSAKAE